MVHCKISILSHPPTLTVSCWGFPQARGILKKCVNSQAVYPLSEQHGLEAQERR